MATRISTGHNFNRLLSGLQTNQIALIRAQEQIASGRRILRPSDDPSGTARVLSLERQLASVGRYREAAASGGRSLNAASSALQEVSNLIAEARGLMLQGSNGVLSDSDRESLGRELLLVRDQMIDMANTTLGGRYLFGGTETDSPPFEVETVNGRSRVVYRGNEEEQRVAVSNGSYVSINVVGSSIFDRQSPTGASLNGSTGLSLGSTANEGSGYEDIRLAHESTDLGQVASSGIALAAGTSEDTLLGVHTLTVDSTNRTIQLGDGEPVAFPEPGSALESNLPVANGAGGTVYLDVTGWNGADLSADITGQGTIQLGDNPPVQLDFSDPDFPIRDEEQGITLFLDTTGIDVEGTELASFSGAASLFDVLTGAAEDLINGDNHSPSEVITRLSGRLDELDRNLDNVLVGLGVVGSRANRLEFADERSANLELQIDNLISINRDADIAGVALQLAVAETTLQTTQASGARMIQNTLLNFLR